MCKWTEEGHQTRTHTHTSSQLDSCSRGFRETTGVMGKRRRGGRGNPIPRKLSGQAPRLVDAARRHELQGKCRRRTTKTSKKNTKRLVRNVSTSFCFRRNSERSGITHNKKQKNTAIVRLRRLVPSNFNRSVVVRQKWMVTIVTHPSQYSYSPLFISTRMYASK